MLKTEQQITAYKSNVTGETSPPHLLGTDEHGRRVYQDPGAEWGPINSAGEEVAIAYDHDGNWVELEPR